MAEFKEEQTASDSIVDNMTVYAGDTIRTKLPNVIDGLKTVQRRIIWTLHVEKKKSDEVVKETTLIGRVMEYHPHGDASIGAAISGMTQPFTYRVPLVYSDSNIGTYSGQKPAAARYMEVSEGDFAKDVFFGEFNLGMLKKIPRETGMGVEPENLVPGLPTTLLLQTFGIAIGVKSETVGLAVGDLCKLTREYIDIRGADRYHWEGKCKHLVKYMLPDFPTNCVLRNSDNILSEYRKGNFDVPIVTDGTMTVKHDMIVFYTLPPDKSFKSVVMDVGPMIKVPGSFENMNFQQMIDFSGKNQGLMTGQFRCTVKRGVNPFDVLAQLKKRVQFTSSWAPSRIYVNGANQMSSETPFTLLNKWYEVRRAAVLGDLKQSLKRLVNEQRKLLALITVVDYTDEIVDIFKKAKDAADTVPILRKRFNLTGMQAEYLSKLTLADITAHGKSDLLLRLEKLKGEQAELNKRFGEIDDIMKNFVTKLEDKYAKEYQRSCVVPKYVGAMCYRGTGWIMLESEEEIDKIIAHDFQDPEDLEITMFQSSCKPIAIGADEDIEFDVPKYFKARAITPTLRKPYSLCQMKDGGSFVMEGTNYIPTAEMSQFVPTSDTFRVVNKTGECVVMKVTDKVIRKSINATPTMRDTLFVSDNTDEECIVIHGNTSQPNRLIVERVKGNSYKLRKIVVGKWRILAIAPVTQKHIYVNIPPELRSRCMTRHIVFDCLGETMKSGQFMECLFGRSVDAGHFKLAPIRRKSTIVLATVK